MAISLGIYPHLDGCTITAPLGGPDHCQGVAPARQGRGHLGEVLADASEVVLTALPMVPISWVQRMIYFVCVCVLHVHI